MKTSTKPRTFAERFQIGATLVPPFAVLWLASRKGWVPLPPVICLAAMPVAVLIGMALPGVFAPWHRFVSAVQSKVGRFILRIVLLAVFYLAVTPLGLLLRLSGKRFLDTADKGGSWVRSRPYGSLRDQF